LLANAVSLLRNIRIQRAEFNCVFAVKTVLMDGHYLEIEPLVSRASESGCPCQYFQGVMPHMVLLHLFLQHRLGDAPLID
jgi:hypothetical protein